VSGSPSEREGGDIGVVMAGREGPMFTHGDHSPCRENCLSSWSYKIIQQKVFRIRRDDTDDEVSSLLAECLDIILDLQFLRNLWRWRATQLPYIGF
jgi:hypothetical protein